MQTEAKVGIAVILGAALLVLLLGRVERWSGGGDEGTRIHARFDNVAGLELRSPVQVAGVKVGEVEAIALDGGLADVTILLAPGVVLHHGAEAAIKSTGLLGEKYLEIVPGQPERGALGQGAEVPQQAGSGDLDRLISKLNEVAVDISDVAKAVREAVATDEGRTQLKDILDNTRAFTEALRQRGPEIMDRLNRIFDKIDRGVGTLGKAVNDPKAYEELEATLADLRQVMARINSGDGTLAKLINDPALYDTLNEAAGGVQQITEKVNSGNGTLGRLLTDSSTVDSFNAAMDSVGQIGSRFERLRTHVTFRNEAQVARGDNKGYVSLRLAPRENRAYVLELVDDPLGRVRKITTETTTGGTTTVTEEVRTDHRLLVTAMFDQRFGDWAVHGGLMETTAGLGVDFLGVDRLQFTLDAWDFDSQRAQHDSPHLKVTARYSLGRNFFVQGGMDNFLNSDFDSPFLGAGLTFEDEDLKYLLGSAASALN